MKAPPLYKEPNSFKKIGEEDLKLIYNLTDRLLKRMRTVNADRLFRSYWWDNKFVSLAIFGVYDSYVLGVDEDIVPLTFLGEAMATYDAMLLAWREKRRHDLMRPGPLLRRLYKGSTVRTFRGLGQKVGPLPVDEWTSLVQTMPHSEYPSASAIICTAVLKHEELLQKDQFGADFVVPPFNLTIAPANVPFIPLSKPITVTFPNLRAAAHDCGQSRLWSGLHFEPAVRVGAALGRSIGYNALRTRKLLDEGIVPSHCHWCVKE